ENARHEMAELPMNENRAEIDEFLRRFVGLREPLMITTDVVRIGAPALDKNLTIADFIRANYGGN
ncbi:MAG: alpha/beta hydrolase, partial [Alistipes sp.]|nr:alpha/beta hydrolase [Alistipes sp.]